MRLEAGTDLASGHSNRAPHPTSNSRPSNHPAASGIQPQDTRSFNLG